MSSVQEETVERVSPDIAAFSERLRTGELAAGNDLHAVDDHVVDAGRVAERLVERCLVLHAIEVENHDIGP